MMEKSVGKHVQRGNGKGSDNSSADIRKINDPEHRKYAGRALHDEKRGKDTFHESVHVRLPR